MAVVGKISPVGIDEKILRFQNHIYNKLGWLEYESYGRVYKVYEGSNVVPEIYIGGGDYTKVLFDDNYNATSFFVVEESRSVENTVRGDVKVSIVFQVDLKALYPAIAHRADEELKVDLYKAVSSNGIGFNLTDIKSEVKNVYEDLTISSDLFDSVKLDDISHRHVVKLDFNIKYDLKGLC